MIVTEEKADERKRHRKQDIREVGGNVEMFEPKSQIIEDKEVISTYISKHNTGD